MYFDLEIWSTQVLDGAIFVFFQAIASTDAQNFFLVLGLNFSLRESVDLNDLPCL